MYNLTYQNLPNNHHAWARCFAQFLSYLYSLPNFFQVISSQFKLDPSRNFLVQETNCSKATKLRRLIKRFVVTVLIGASALWGIHGKTKACTVEPVDMIKVVEDIQRFALLALNVDESDIRHLSVENAFGSYIWTDPMCPEGIEASATFTVNYLSKGDALTKGCTGIASVRMTKPTGMSDIPVKYKYITEFQPGTCLE